MNLLKLICLLLTLSISTLIATADQDGYKDISAGGSHFMVLKNDGTLWGWGKNSDYEYSNQLPGVLGDGTTIDRHSPVKLHTGVRKVAVGGDVSIWLMEDGTLRTTGKWNEGD